MVEEHTGAGKQLVALTEVHRDPVSIELSYTIGAAWIEGCLLILWKRLHFPEHLGATGLVETNGPIGQSYSLEHTCYTKPRIFTCSNSLLKGGSYKRHGCQIVDFIRLRFAHGLNQ